MNDDHNIPPNRAALYYIGNALIAIGFLLCFGTIAAGAISVERGPMSGSGPSFMPFLVGFVMFGVGGVLRSIGAAGWAGSGVILNPKRGRQDLKPWSKMAGGMVNDALEEVDAVKNAQTAPREVVKVRCPKCRTLNDENARFCDNCGQALS